MHEEALQALREIAEEICGDVDWHGDYGDITCPAGHDDATVFINGVPTIYCYHERCKSAIEDWNQDLRQRWNDFRAEYSDEDTLWTPTAEDRARWKLEKECKRITADTKHTVLCRILRQPPVDLEAFTATSPCPIPAKPQDHWRLLIGGMFEFGKRYDAIWCGELHETGSLNFDTVERWLEYRNCPGPQLCPSLFRFVKSNAKGKTVLDHAVTRSKKWVFRRDYFIVESDTLTVGQFLNVVLWLQSQGFVLRAVIHTGGKSVHCWFDKEQSPDVAGARRRLEYEKEWKEERAEHRRKCGACWDWRDRRFDAWERKNQKRRYPGWQRQADLKAVQWPANQERFKAVLIGLGCDERMLGLASTTRMPGWYRDDEKAQGWQRLVYFNPKFPGQVETIL